MAAKNTVEATLRSNYVDGVSSALSKTQAIAQANFSAMSNASTIFSSGTNTAFQSVTGALHSWQQKLTAAAQESDSTFKSMSLGAAAGIAGIAVALLSVAKNVGSYLIERARESSKITELKLSYEALSAATGHNEDMVSKMGAATHGLVGKMDLLKNANRLMSSGVKVSSEDYEKLVANVFKLAKASGADASQAINTLTDSLIKGNARGFQAIGIHVGVKDAISEMAAAQGESAAKLSGSARMQAFYNELLEQTSRAADVLPEHFATIDEAILRAEKGWKSYFNAIGEGINRSHIFQEVLKASLRWMEGIGAKKGEIDAVALATNRFILSTLNGLGNLMRMLSVMAAGWDVMTGTMMAAWNIMWTALYGGLTSIATAITAVLTMLSSLGGAIATKVKPALDAAQGYMAEFAQGFKASAVEVTHSFDGFGDKTKAAWAFGGTLKAMAADMEQYSGKTVKGTAALLDQVATTEKATASQSHYNDQLKKYFEMLAALQQRSQSPGREAFLKLGEDMRKIQELDLSDVAGAEKKKNTLRLAAIGSWMRATEKAMEAEAAKVHAMTELVAEATTLSKGLADHTKAQIEKTMKELPTTMEEFNTEAAKRSTLAWRIATDELLAEQRAKAVQQAHTLANIINLSRAGQLPPDFGQRVLKEIPAQIDVLKRKIAELRSQKVLGTDQLQQLADLYEAIGKLNRIDLSPYQQALQNLKDHTAALTQGTLDAWSSFWADLVSGQENAGKKFIAALINMVANEIMVLATQMLAKAVVAYAVGDYGGAARYAAAAAGLGALAGTLKGLASVFAQTNKASATGGSSTFQQNTPVPNNQPQIIQVGANGGASTPGQAQPRVLGIIEVRPSDGAVAKSIKEDFRTMGPIRTMVMAAG